MSIVTTEDAYKLMGAETPLSYDDSFDLARLCASLLRGDSTEATGRDIIIRTLDEFHRHPPETAKMWNNLVEVAGLYPYVKPDLLTGSSRVRYEFHRAAHLPDICFHAEQAMIASELRSGMSVVASAPTSFGKSLLIDEIVAAKRYNNIVVIQPTLALLDETRKRFRKFGDDFHIVLSTSQSPITDKRNLFLFTAERVVEYDAFPPIEFFVIDEFYKLSLERDDDRAITLNQALYKLLKHTKHFYFLGPAIHSVPTQQESGLAYHWFPSKFATVATEEIALSRSLKKNTPEKRELLFNTLDALGDPTIIYCAAPNGASQLANQYGTWLNSRNVPGQIVSEEIDAMREWVSDNISARWCLHSLLAQGIAFHHGGIPRHLSSAIVDAFNHGSIRYLFCTSTLIEGVNTTAKNIILYDKKKGVKAIDYFDFRNIAGRSGRMLQHYIGHVYKFEDSPDQLDLHVDFPILTQINAPAELLMSIDPDDLKVEGRANIAKYDNLDSQLKEIIRQNPSVPIDGQLKIVEVITQNLREWHSLLSWRSFPNYYQLLRPLELAWENLRRPKESKGGASSAKQLATLTLIYASLKSLRGVIQNQFSERYWIDKHPDVNERTDVIVSQILGISRHWFDYKLPTYLIAVSNLQKYVCDKVGLSAGDYSAFAAQIENGFLKRSFSDLSEYGIPRSAISKIASRLDDTDSVERIIAVLRSSDLSAYRFTRYELQKVRQAL